MDPLLRICFCLCLVPSVTPTTHSKRAQCPEENRTKTFSISLCPSVCGQIGKSWRLRAVLKSDPRGEGGGRSVEVPTYPGVGQVFNGMHNVGVGGTASGIPGSATSAKQQQMEAGRTQKKNFPVSLPPSKCLQTGGVIKVL